LERGGAAGELRQRRRAWCMIDVPSAFSVVGSIQLATLEPKLAAMSALLDPILRQPEINALNGSRVQASKQQDARLREKEHS
jgi:hypothetical protein